MQMLILYFKLVDKIESGLTASSFAKFESLFASKVAGLLSKIQSSVTNKLKSDICSVQIVFYDSFGNGQDLRSFMDRNKVDADWSATDFLNQIGGIFSVKLRISEISSIIRKETFSKQICLKMWLCEGGLIRRI